MKIQNDNKLNVTYMSQGDEDETKKKQKQKEII